MPPASPSSHLQRVDSVLNPINLLAGPRRMHPHVHQNWRSDHIFACIRSANAPIGTKGRSPPCTKIGRYRSEADKPGRELAVKSAAPDRTPGGRFRTIQVRLKD